MKIQVMPEVFARFPDLEIGLVAARGIDNFGTDREIEAFFRHVLLEAALLLRLKPVETDPSILLLREKLAEMGAAGVVSSAEMLLAELADGIEREKEADVEFAPGKTTGLIGLSALSRQNPVSDLVRAASLESRLSVFFFDVGTCETISVRETKGGEIFTNAAGGKETLLAGEPVWALDEVISVRYLFSDRGKTGTVTEETRNIVLAVPCFAASRRRAMSVRNELARRLSESFGRDTEAGWISKDASEMVSER